MEEALDVKSIREKFEVQHSFSSTLPPKTNISTRRSGSNILFNPEFANVISVLENDVKIRKAPDLPLKPSFSLNDINKHTSSSKINSKINSKKKVGIFKDQSNFQAEFMKLSKNNRQTWNVADSVKKQEDGTCEFHPQKYIPLLDTQIGPAPPDNTTITEEFYEVVKHCEPRQADENSNWQTHAKVNANSVPVTFSNGEAEISDSFYQTNLNIPQANAPVSDLELPLITENRSMCFNSILLVKPLPPYELLGPPPEKPPRPPHVDLNAVLAALTKMTLTNQQSEDDLEEYDQTLPRPEVDGGECYEDVLLVKNDSVGDSVYEAEPDTTTEVEYEVSADDLQHSKTSASFSEVEYEYKMPHESASQNTGQIHQTEVKVGKPEIALRNKLKVSADDLQHSKTSASFSEVEYEYKMPQESATQNTGQIHQTEVKVGKPEIALRNKFKISGSEGILYQAHVLQDIKDGKHMLATKKGEVVDIVRITDCPKGKWLARNDKGQYGFVPVHSVEMDKSIFIYTNHIMDESLQPIDIYDDVEHKNIGVFSMDNSLTSDNYSEKSEDAYDDVGNESDLSKSVDRILKKGFVNDGKRFFKKEKEKPKKNVSKLSTLQLSNPAEEPSQVYETDMNHIPEVEREEKLTNWKSRLLKPKRPRKSDSYETNISKSPTSRYTTETQPASDAFETGSYSEIDREEKSPTWRSRFLKPKQKGKSEGLDIEKKTEESKKMAKEEKMFRERFQYNKEIEVINVAVVNVMAPIQAKDKLDLLIKPGEELDVIDVTDENRVICRNSEGKFGKVLIQHLDFKVTAFNSSYG
ncbi:FYN-binding protein 2 [Bombina bombina]|uniref:FYN-binding protein 2 n=1 Tax=Bombina bombina TaxID=8345 RepID=UPI00235A6B3B|nr:FYN-binding protein 2 [Bombina bombina]